MNTQLSVDVVAPRALSAGERAAWRAFTAASPKLQSPFFSLDFALATDGVVPGASVAVVHAGDYIAGFLPFQRRGGCIQPLGAPLCDNHGLIAAAGHAPDLAEVVRLIGAGAYRFGALSAEAPPPGRIVAHALMKADVSGSQDAYLERRPQTRKFFKDKVRATRAAERDLGPLEFNMDDPSPEALDFVLAHKREQYRASGLHDIFACGWTEALLRRLWSERTPSFGGRLATLRAGGRLIAAEFGLRGGAVRHIWFPAYDPEFSRWGPGTLLMIETAKAAAADPTLSELDFGKEGASYKRFYAEPTGIVYEGSLDLDPVRQISSRAADLTLTAAPGLKPLVEIRDRMRRRFDIITACETRPAAWVGGAMDAFLIAGRRPAAAVGT